ncbi:MAG: hypothetical protein AAGI03_10355 [Pseudomonadota bacterium]
MPAAKAEITKAMQTYLSLHRHAAVRADVLKGQDVALRLIAAHILTGSSLWHVRAEPQRCDKEAIRESLESSPLQKTFAEERQSIVEMLAEHSDGKDDRETVSCLKTLIKMTDDELLRLLTFLMAETLEADTFLIEYLGLHLGTDPAVQWSPDEAFFDLLRDKAVINAMVAEAAGETVAKAILTATAKVQKGIPQDCLAGYRKDGKTDWYPRYMAFPMRAYTNHGGIRAMDLADTLLVIEETAEQAA